MKMQTLSVKETNRDLLSRTHFNSEVGYLIEKVPEGFDVSGGPRGETLKRKAFVPNANVQAATYAEPEEPKKK